MAANLYPSFHNALLDKLLSFSASTARHVHGLVSAPHQLPGAFAYPRLSRELPVQRERIPSCLPYRVKHHGMMVMGVPSPRDTTLGYAESTGEARKIFASSHERTACNWLSSLAELLLSGCHRAHFCNQGEVVVSSDGNVNMLCDPRGYTTSPRHRYKDEVYPFWPLVVGVVASPCAARARVALCKGAGHEEVEFLCIFLKWLPERSSSSALRGPTERLHTEPRRALLSIPATNGTPWR